jgi:exodeoxyribonuclease-3
LTWPGPSDEHLAAQSPDVPFSAYRTVKIVSWNVNGVRSVLRKGFLEFLAAEQPDMLCLQETKAPADAFEPLLAADYQTYWNVADRKGYAGTALFSKTKPLSVQLGLGIPAHDQEGRVITAEFEAFYLVSVYVPNSKNDLSRLPYRQVWDRDFLKYLRRLERRKPVVFCGDLNVAHTEIDLARPKGNVGAHGFTDEERAGFEAFLKAGFRDSFREFEKGPGHYTWWSVMMGARPKDIGWRIDYVMVSKALRPKLKSAFIRKHVLGSDHCPVGIELDL